MRQQRCDMCDGTTDHETVEVPKSGGEWVLLVCFVCGHTTRERVGRVDKARAV